MNGSDYQLCSITFCNASSLATVKDALKTFPLNPLSASRTLYEVVFRTGTKIAEDAGLKVSASSFKNLPLAPLLEKGIPGAAYRDVEGGVFRPPGSIGAHLDAELARDLVAEPDSFG